MVIWGPKSPPYLSVTVNQFLRPGAGRDTNLSDAIFASAFSKIAAKTPQTGNVS